MTNTWKVISIEKGRKRLTRFADVKDAVDFRNRLREDQIEAHVVSAVHAYKIPQLDKRGRPHPKSRPPSSRARWCPYCIEWRDFVFTALRDREGILGPAQWRCPICSISVEDFYVKKYNHTLGVVSDEKLYKGVITMRKISA